MASNAIVPNRDRIATLAQALGGKKDYLAKCLPKHLTAERVIKVALLAASRTPTLLNCTPESFVLAVIQASQLGLEAGSPLGEAYLVPYKDQCTLIVGYRGLIALARRSGEIEAIEAHVVHAKDTLKLAYGLDAELVHTPWMPTPPENLDELAGEALAEWEKNAHPGPMTAVYAVARLKGGVRQVEVMTRAEVDAIRRRSRASGSGPWVTDYEEMAKKTVVRRIAKYLPMSIEMAAALDDADRRERGEAIDVTALADGIDLNAPAQLPQGRPSATDQLKGSLKQREPVAVVTREPGDDGDEPPPNPPTGTDAPRGGASNDTGAAGTGRESGGTKGPVAKVRELRVERDRDEVDYAKDADAWTQHLASAENDFAVAGALHKRSDRFAGAGVWDARKNAAVKELVTRGHGRDAAVRFIDEYPLRKARAATGT